ncbi:hypothetical protein B0T13DRAFT_490449 [Neurospora crassa]|nr:hypothetical protein B0T13DRAFT_490449 [Neurospora crassa]
MAALIVLLSSFAPFVAGQFEIAPTGAFAGLGLAAICESVLYQSINCDAYVLNLGQKVYHGSPGDKTFTDTICSTTCWAALQTARRRIVGACAQTPNLFPGYPVLAMIDPVVSGWNETCLKDSDGGYCNAKIEMFPEVENIEDMPQAQLCSFCLGAKLRLMQSSPYSAYDELHAERLEYINKRCGAGTGGSTSPLPPAIQPNGTTSDTCVSGNKYTVKNGDTCNSVAQTNSVSSSTLYYINPELLSCSAPDVDLELCLPDRCETTYMVKEADDCVTIAIRAEGSAASSWQDLVAWNAGLDDRCSNIWSPSSSPRYWGNVICISAPGGLPSSPGTEPGNDNGDGTGNGNIGGPGGSGDGYADLPVPVPTGGTIAQGTTTLCGAWVQAQSDSTCSSLIVGTAVPISLWLLANPSLREPVNCSKRLRVGSWARRLQPVPRVAHCPYCLVPYRLQALGSREKARPMVATASLQFVLAALFLSHGAWSQFTVPPDTTADPNTIKTCTWWHVAGSGDSCTSIASTYGITSEQFARWDMTDSPKNPSVATACKLTVGNSYCIENNFGQDDPPTPSISSSTLVGTATTSTTASATTGNGISTPTPIQEGMATTTTSSGNGITTPTPTQAGMVGNCDRFHLVKSGDQCGTIASTYGITLANFYSWNPAVGTSCQSLWLDTYVCVRTIGFVPPKTTTTTTKKPTSTTSAGGVATPTPTQPGMVSGCKKFHKGRGNVSTVASGDQCGTIATRYGISLASFYSWNPAVGSSCQTLWLDYYVCVGR